MKSAFLRHSTVTAAAVLFAAAGTLLAAQPAHAQQAVAPVFDHYVELRAADNARWHGDRSAPVIASVTPQQGEAVSDRGRTRITARFWDAGTGVRSVSLVIDGRDVTRISRIDGNEIRVRENLKPGRHFAQVVVRDHAGNVSRRSWNFEVFDAHRHYSYNGPVGLQRR
jgi:hypothetical protein